MTIATQTPCVAIVLVNYRAWRHTLECLDSLIGQDFARFHVFVVDNDSRDGSVQELSRWCAAPVADPEWKVFPGVVRWTDQSPGQPVGFRVEAQTADALPAAGPGLRLTILRSNGNLGFAGGCNVGIRAAGLENYDFFWLLNTDTVVTAGTLSALVARACESGAGITGSMIRYYDAPGILQVMGGARFDRRTSTSVHIGSGTPIGVAARDAGSVEDKLDYIMGASMLVSRDFVRTVGLMREDYFLFFEEIDWALRGAAQFKLAYAPASQLFHKSGASSAKTMKAFSTRYYYRNRIRFAKRFFPEHLASVRMSLIKECARHLLRGRWLHVRIIAESLRDYRELVKSAALPP